MAKYVYTGFKTAKQLDIPADVRASMIRLLKGIDRGEYIDGQDWQEASIPKEREYKMQGVRGVIEMDTCFGGKSKHCGSVGCIAGHVGLELRALGKLRARSRANAGGKILVLGEGNQPLHRLFMAKPTNSNLTLSQIDNYLDRGVIRLKHVARALRNYLRTGEPRWEKVMGDV